MQRVGVRGVVRRGGYGDGHVQSLDMGCVRVRGMRPSLDETSSSPPRLPQASGERARVDGVVMRHQDCSSSTVRKAFQDRGRRQRGALLCRRQSSCLAMRGAAGSCVDAHERDVASARLLLCPLSHFLQSSQPFFSPLSPTPPRSLPAELGCGGVPCDVEKETRWSEKGGSVMWLCTWQQQFHSQVAAGSAFDTLVRRLGGVRRSACAGEFLWRVGRVDRRRHTRWIFDPAPVSGIVNTGTAGVRGISVPRARCIT
ncbi:hypothetical protein C8R46DRAFT_1123160 [Mycena filopes]|nr:hypothetical protein C8R46DRAFT_1123160 [Mycena filopes]